VKKLLTLATIVMLLVSPLAAKAEKQADIDYVALAALLMRDGHYDRAETALQQVDPEDGKVDKVRFYTLGGMVFMKKGLYVTAVEQFEKAIAAGQNDPVIHLYIAQAHYALKAYGKTLDDFARAGELAGTKPGFFAMAAQCHWMLEARNDALGVLNEGLAAFPEHNAFLKQAFHYMVELQLYQEALHYAERYLDGGNADAEAYLAIGSALKGSGEYGKALRILEKAHLRFPDNARLTVLLAHVYIDLGRLHAAADLFDRAAVIESTYIAEASEMYRRARELYRAIYLNARIADQQEKYRQRMAILLEFGDFEKAAAMADALERVNLVENEDIRYALAFSLYQVGDYEATEQQLQQLSRPDLFQKATRLRANIEKCEQNPWECYE
jgi:tetratricopeptide (TPR) repeat protein